MLVHDWPLEGAPDQTTLGWTAASPAACLAESSVINLGLTLYCPDFKPHSHTVLTDRNDSYLQVTLTVLRTVE